MASHDERAQLQQARELILQKQFAEARVILRGMAHNTTAQQWLTKLDQIAPETGAPQAPAAPVSAAPSPAAPASWPRPAAAPSSQTINVAFNLDVRLVRYAVAALVGVLSVMMIVGFAAFPWLDMTDISFMGFSLDAFGGEVDKGPLEVTALELWSGRNSGENITLDLTVTDGQGAGFADVRLLDRFLVLLPLLGLVLGWLAWMYAFPAGDGMSPAITAAVMAFMALVLFLFPFAWEDMSTNIIEDDVKSMMTYEGGEDLGLDFGFFDTGMFTGIFTESYSTGEQQLLGGLALLAALVGFAVEVLHGRAAVPARR